MLGLLPFLGSLNPGSAELRSWGFAASHLSERHRFAGIPNAQLPISERGISADDGSPDA
jgi:hypothetical protein